MCSYIHVSVYIYTYIFLYEKNPYKMLYIVWLFYLHCVYGSCSLRLTVSLCWGIENFLVRLRKRLPMSSYYTAFSVPLVFFFSFIFLFFFSSLHLASAWLLRCIIDCFWGMTSYRSRQLLFLLLFFPLPANEKMLPTSTFKYFSSFLLRSTLYCFGIEYAILTTAQVDDRLSIYILHHYVYMHSKFISRECPLHTFNFYFFNFLIAKTDAVTI